MIRSGNKNGRSHLEEMLTRIDQRQTKEKQKEKVQKRMNEMIKGRKKLKKK